MLMRFSQEAKETEVTLHDDDPDAVEAIIRHLYNFKLEPPPCEESHKEVRFYCNVVVASDKYALPGLAEEAALHLTSKLVNVEAPADVIVLLRIIVEEYGDYESLQICALGQLKSRLKELASAPDLMILVTSQPQLFEQIVGDAVRFRDLQRTNRYSCHFCHKVILDTGTANPMCCRNKTGLQGFAYLTKDS